jgi:hypothetical protein
MFERFPARDGTLCGLDRNLSERACRNSRRVGKAPHLVGCDFAKTAAAAEVQCKRVTGNVGERCHKILGRRKNGLAPVGVQERPVLEVHVGIANQRGENEPQSWTYPSPPAFTERGEPVLLYHNVPPHFSRAPMPGAGWRGTRLRAL